MAKCKKYKMTREFCKKYEKMIKDVMRSKYIFFQKNSKGKNYPEQQP